MDEKNDDKGIEKENGQGYMLDNTVLFSLSLQVPICLFPFLCRGGRAMFI